MAPQVKLPRIITPLPGPRAAAIVADDQRYVSPSYTRSYPLVASKGFGAIVEDVDGNLFLDFSAGIAVCSTGHCHPDVVRAIQECRHWLSSLSRLYRMGDSGSASSATPVLRLLRRQ